MAPQQMREAIVSKGPSVKLVDSPLPKAEKDQVVIKVVVSGSNPKDWKLPEWTGKDGNTGDDIAGTVHEVGQDVHEFKAGDRVAAFHVMTTPGGSFAEYAVAPASTTFHLPPHTSFEEGAAIPLAALTAADGLYYQLRLPEPWIGAQKPTPLIIYGASSACGIYALQFALRSNIHPIIAISGRAQSYVEKFIDRSKGDTIVDYRKGDDAVVQGIREAAKGAKLHYAFDAVAEHGSFDNIGKALHAPGGMIAHVLPIPESHNIPEGIEQLRVYVGRVHNETKDLGYIYSRYIAHGLEEGWFKPQPHEVIPGGLEGVQKGLQNLKDGKASAVKYVFRIADTPGLSK